jgi:demethylspheroidene O-methyltransferase
MAAISPSDEPRPKFWDKWRARYLDLVGTAAFQSWAARSLFTRGTAKRDGERLFDLVAGFTYSQILQAFVALDLQRHLRARPAYPSELAAKIDAPERRISVLCQAAASLGLLTRLRDGRYALARLGAAINGVGGLRDMILHHDILYRDLGPAEGFFRGETDPDLARFWPYVFGAAAAEDPATAERYSHLMSETQNLVSDEILSSLSFGTLFDLPQVAALAQDRFERAGIATRATIVSGSFRDDPLPLGPDLITLIRVLYDHEDETVLRLLKSVHAALPEGGKIVIAEPMSGGEAPDRSADAYFALYCMAMGTGTVRSAAQINELLSKAGFARVSLVKTGRPFVTRIVTAEKTVNKS